jgi:hypothetical protein
MASFGARGADQPSFPLSSRAAHITSTQIGGQFASRPSSFSDVNVLTQVERIRSGATRTKRPSNTLPTPRRYLHGDPDNVIAFAMACCCASCDKFYKRCLKADHISPRGALRPR